MLAYCVHVLKVASTDGLMHFLVAYYCTIFIVNLLFVICTWQINFSLSHPIEVWRLCEMLYPCTFTLLIVLWYMQMLLTDWGLVVPRARLTDLRRRCFGSAAAAAGGGAGEFTMLSLLSM